MNKKASVYVLMIAAFVCMALVYGRSQQQLLQEKRSQFAPQSLASTARDSMDGTPTRRASIDITRPRYIPAREATFMRDDDQVYRMRLNGTEYIYPANILGFHHVVNDVIDGMPLAITLCMLTHSAIAFDARPEGSTSTLNLGDTRATTFGNFIMYDKATDMLWQQMTGELLSNVGARKLSELYALESTTWAKVKNDAVRVLAPEKNMASYRDFYSMYSSSTIGLEQLKQKETPDKRLSPMELGFGISIHDAARFYPFAALSKDRATNDVLGGWALVILYDEKYELFRIFRRYYRERVLTFEEHGSDIIDKETHSTWNAEGEAVSGPLRGAVLSSPEYREAYWFAWSAFFPTTDIFSNSS